MDGTHGMEDWDHWNNTNGCDKGMGWVVAIDKWDGWMKRMGGTEVNDLHSEYC